MICRQWVGCRQHVGVLGGDQGLGKLSAALRAILAEPRIDIPTGLVCVHRMRYIHVHRPWARPPGFVRC